MGRLSEVLKRDTWDHYKSSNFTEMLFVLLILPLIDSRGVRECWVVTITPQVKHLYLNLYIWTFSYIWKDLSQVEAILCTPKNWFLKKSQYSKKDCFYTCNKGTIKKMKLLNLCWKFLQCALHYTDRCEANWILSFTRNQNHHWWLPSCCMNEWIHSKTNRLLCKENAKVY